MIFDLSKNDIQQIRVCIYSTEHAKIHVNAKEIPVLETGVEIVNEELSVSSDDCKFIDGENHWNWVHVILENYGICVGDKLIVTLTPRDNNAFAVLESFRSYGEYVIASDRLLKQYLFSNLDQIFSKEIIVTENMKQLFISCKPRTANGVTNIGIKVEHVKSKKFTTKNYSKSLFVCSYFRQRIWESGDKFDDRSLFLSTSKDGIVWVPKGRFYKPNGWEVRDPHIFIANDAYYVVCTDVSEPDYNGDHFVVLKSLNLQDWIYHASITPMIDGSTMPKIFAPEVVSDDYGNMYAVFSAGTRSPGDMHTYYAKFNSEFTDIGEPMVLDFGIGDEIDATIIKFKGKYYAALKEEATDRSIILVSDNQFGGYRKIGDLGYTGLEGYTMIDKDDMIYLYCDEYSRHPCAIRCFRSNDGSNWEEVELDEKYQFRHPTIKRFTNFDSIAASVICSTV